MPDVVPSFARSKGEDGMSRPTLSDHMCFLMAMMAFHARRHPTVCAIQCPCEHATLDVMRPCVKYKYDDGMPHQRRSTVCAVLRAKMALNALRSPTVCAVQER